MEQGYKKVPYKGDINDEIRQVNKEGWNVKQIVVLVRPEGLSDGAFGLLLER